MSTLRVTNVQDTAGANSATTAQIYNGIAKAWVNFNGVTMNIRSSHNVATVTDAGSALATVTFTTAMPNVNYSIFCSAGYTGATQVAAAFAPISAPTTSNFTLAYTYGGSFSVANLNLDYVFAAVYST